PRDRFGGPHGHAGAGTWVTRLLRNWAALPSPDRSGAPLSTRFGARRRWITRPRRGRPTGGDGLFDVTSDLFNN
ncbi:MAG: hypothetical protein ACRDYY_15960, partial [Acidimicrobiales bacterium]